MYIPAYYKNLSTDVFNHPGELTINHRLPTTAKLSWAQLPGEERHDVLAGYHVQVAGPDSGSRREISIDKADVTSIEISNLNPFTLYHFSISAKTTAGLAGPGLMIDRPSNHKEGAFIQGVDNQEYNGGFNRNMMMAQP